MTRRLGFRTALTILKVDNDHDQNPIVLVQSSRFAVAVSVSVQKKGEKWRMNWCLGMNYEKRKGGLNHGTNVMLVDFSRG